jgi:hypothetical protein
MDSASTETLHPQGYSTEKIVEKLFPCSKTKRWYQVRAGAFPQPIYSGRQKLWRNSDLIEHGEALARGETPTYPRRPQKSNAKQAGACRVARSTDSQDSAPAAMAASGRGRRSDKSKKALQEVATT